MTAIPVLRIEQWTSAMPARTRWAMARKSDVSNAASAIAAGQKRRLRWLRTVLMPVQADAARVAGVSSFSWNRMEMPNGTQIDIVALARFCGHHQVPAEYVVSGDLSGLPRELQRSLVAVEQAETQEPAAAGTSGP
jgi:hypothetical protein